MRADLVPTMPTPSTAAFLGNADIVRSSSGTIRHWRSGEQPRGTPLTGGGRFVCGWEKGAGRFRDDRRFSAMRRTSRSSRPPSDATMWMRYCARISRRLTDSQT